jgi:uncharacterized protein (DUF58 family)
VPLRAFARVHRVSTWAKRRVTPAGLSVLGAMLAGFVFGIDVGRTMAFQLFAIAAALMVVAWIGAGRWRPQVHLERRLPPFATVGRRFEYLLRVRDRGGRGLPAFQLRDELETRYPSAAQFARLGRAQDPAGNFFDRRVGYPRWVMLLERLRGGSVEPADVPAIPAEGTAEVRLALEPRRRGVLHYASTSLLRPDPLGLVHAVARRATSQALLVVPRVHPVPRIVLPGARRHHPQGMQAVQQVGESQEFLQLRDYRPGDPVRRLHWPSTARAGRPIVRESSEEWFARHALVLDTFEPRPEPERFEAAVSAAASIAVGLDPGDALLDLMFVEERAVSVTAGRGTEAAGVLLRELAQGAPAQHGGFDALATHVLRHAGRLSACIHVLLCLDEPRAALLRALHAAGVGQIVLLAGEGAAAQAPAGVPVHRLDPARLAESLAAMPAGVP